MFGDLVNLYCSYCDLADYYFWASRDWDRKEKYLEYHRLAEDLEKVLASMCEGEVKPPLLWPGRQKF